MRWGSSTLARRALPLLFVAMGAPCAFFACNVIFGIDEPKLRVDAPPDTGVPLEETGCVRATWPSAPATEDDAGGDQSFVVALREIGITVAPSGPPLGYDLDGLCTCDPDPGACVRRVPADAGGNDAYCDEPGGRDVVLNREILALITQDEGFSPARLNAALEKGRYGIIAEVRGYNGGLNDKSVQVSLFISSGTANDAGPSWDGGDPWDLDPTSVAGGADGGAYRSAYVDNSAYVADGVLVASKLSDLKVALGTGDESLELELAQAVMTAKITRVGAAYALTDGMIAGRWPTASIMRAIAPLPDPLSKKPLCAPEAKFTYDYAKGTICKFADLSQNPVRDKDRGADCDALSFGMRFRAEAATFGGLRARPAPDGGCGDWIDDCPKP